MDGRYRAWFKPGDKDVALMRGGKVSPGLGIYNRLADSLDGHRPDCA
jgi:hypothetical protein